MSDKERKKEPKSNRLSRGHNFDNGSPTTHQRDTRANRKDDGVRGKGESPGLSTKGYLF